MFKSTHSTITYTRKFRKTICQALADPAGLTDEEKKLIDEFHDFLFYDIDNEPEHEEITLVFKG